MLNYNYRINPKQSYFVDADQKFNKAVCRLGLIETTFEGERK